MEGVGGRKEEEPVLPPILRCSDPRAVRASNHVGGRARPPPLCSVASFRALWDWSEAELSPSLCSRAEVNRKVSEQESEAPFPSHESGAAAFERRTNTTTTGSRGPSTHAHLTEEEVEERRRRKKTMQGLALFLSLSLWLASVEPTFLPRSKSYNHHRLKRSLAL